MIDMALKSMTGFGRGDARAKGVRAHVELSSVNRKTLDIRISLPRFASSLESRVVKEIRKCFSRGHITGTVDVSTDKGTHRTIVVDEAAAASYLSALRKTGRKLKLQDDLSLRNLLQFPDVVKVERPETDADSLFPVVSKALRTALKALSNMRAVEGEALTKDLAHRMEMLGNRLAQIEKLRPKVAAAYKSALLARLTKVGVKVASNDPLLLKELAVFADKADIAEEMTRLASHLAQADKLLLSAKPAGRTLDFLSQEMFREINTIGSKANNARIAKHVVLFKTELERVREQSQNVE
jgi:uncharacterized protein (TIGR00255 family)